MVVIKFAGSNQNGHITLTSHQKIVVQIDSWAEKKMKPITPQNKGKENPRIANLMTDFLIVHLRVLHEFS